MLVGVEIIGKPEIGINDCAHLLKKRAVLDLLKQPFLKS